MKPKLFNIKEQNGCFFISHIDETDKETIIAMATNYENAVFLLRKLNK